MAGEPVRSELREAVAIAHFDDGKANALSHAAIQALEAHLDRAEREAGAVLSKRTSTAPRGRPAQC
jgi:enoyl-CoA hydratase/carnithine racemase